MKLRLMLAPLFMAVVCAATAKEVTQQEARQVANNFFYGGVMTASAAGGMQTLWDSESLSSSDGISLASVKAPTFYVFAPASGKGFVIVSGDDASRPVLGYSFENEAPVNEDLPCNVRCWFELMDTYIEDLRAQGAAASAKVEQEWLATRASYDEVVLETAKWNQYSPFNMQCPWDDSGISLTGCVQTGFAIAMRYHQWPQKATGVTEAYTTSTKRIKMPMRNLEHEYDWDNMPLSYSSYTTEQAYQVSNLMADLGYLLQADYANSSTGTYILGTLNQKMHDHFGYSRNMHWEHGNLYDQQDWYALLQDNIDQGMPIVFWGSQNSSSSHVFVIDGYNSSDYFDVNWGWGGQSNGFVLLDNMTYCYDQIALLGFRPEEEGEEDETLLKDEFDGKGIKIGSAISSVSAIEENQWYLVASNYNSNKGCYLWDISGDLYVSGSSSAVWDGMSATDASHFLTRFIPTEVSGFSGDTYYMQFGTGKYASIAHSDYEYVTTYDNMEDAVSVNPHDMSQSGGGGGGQSSGSGHIGFYSADSYKYSIYAAWGPDMWALSYKYSNAQQNSGFDFTVYPVDLEVLDETGTALADCRAAYYKYKAYVGTFATGTAACCYGEEAVAAFEEAVSAAAVCVGSEASDLTIETLNQLAEDMADAFDAVMGSYVAASTSVADGYYFIEPAGYDYNIEPAMHLYTFYNNYYVKWGALEATPDFLWKVTDNGDGAYEVRNMGGDLVLDDLVSGSYASLSANSESLVSFDFAQKDVSGNNLFYIHTSTDDSGVRLWAASTGSGSGTTGWVWAGSVSGQDAMWKLVPVSDEEADYIINGFSHSCEAEFSDWSVSGNSGSELFQRNTWSTEEDDSGMKTPFVEYWVSGTMLSDATISHVQLTGLPVGTYKVSIDARMFAETAVDAINEGTTFNVNGESVDLTSGTAATYGTETEVYGSYSLLCDVDSEGTLDISFNVSNANYNWLSWKNLSVETFEDMPELTAAEGLMNGSVLAAQTAALSAYASNATAHNYNLALAAIAAAEKSVAYYACITAVVDALDEAGLTVWQNTEDSHAYGAKQLTDEDVTPSLVVAQRAQQAAGSDLSLVAKYDGTWAATQGNGPASCPSRGTATETYNTAGYSEGGVLSCTISSLQAGTYEISFYAQANAANVTGVNSGENIAQVYANGATQDISVGTATTCEYSDDDIYTLTATVDSEGILEFGMRNTASGGNWYTAEALSLTLIGLYDGTEDGISSAVATNVDGGAIYTIQGIRVSDMNQPGVYIQNGKKFVVK